MRIKLERLLLPFALLLVCATCVVSSIALVRVQNDEQTACEIQRRALPADRAISAAWADWQHLTHVSLGKQNLAKAKKQLTPKEYAVQVAIVTSLDRHIKQYQRAQAQQPLTRKC